MQFKFVSLLAALCAFWFQFTVSGAEGIAPETVVGLVMGKPITAKDIDLTKPIDVTLKFDSRNTESWKQMGKIGSVFGGPIAAKFVKSHNIEATEDEIRQFDESTKPVHEEAAADLREIITTLKQELETKGLTQDEKTEIEKKLKNLEKASDDKLKADDDNMIATAFIMSWRFEQQLYRKYSGRVIFQQAGPEALDARRLLYEEAEKAGDLKFNDDGVKHMFYYYYNMQHVVIKDKKVFDEQPWFLKSVSKKPPK